MKTYNKKPKRPSNWANLTDKEKIKWLQSLSRPNASEKKELKELLLKEKYKGIAEYVANKREMAKRTPEYMAKVLAQERKECREYRKVRTCSQCLRYAECHHGKPAYKEGADLTDCERRLALAIIVNAMEEYRLSYRFGYKNALKSVRLWLTTSEQVDVLSMGEYDGIALDEHMYRNCEKRYGKFEDIYQKVQTKLLAKIKALEIKHKKARGNKRVLLCNEISYLKGCLSK